MLRRQLEILRAEGVIREADFQDIVAAHPRSVSAQSVDIPASPFGPKGDQVVTYPDAAAALIGLVAQSFSDTQSLHAKLDPLGVGWIDSSHLSDIALDMIVATLVVRNQALYSLFPERMAGGIEAAVLDGILISLGHERGQLYAFLVKQWIESVTSWEVPQSLLAAALMHRSAAYSGTTYKENPLIEIVFSEPVVTSHAFYWPRLAGMAALKPG